MKTIISKKVEKLLKKSEKDIKNRKNLSPVFTNLEKLDLYLVNL